MTTRTDTKKFELLQSSPKVAILVHDFPQARDAAAQPSASPSSPPPPPSSSSSEAGSGSKGKDGTFQSTCICFASCLLIECC